MTTLREAAQQALEALNRSDYLGWQFNIPIIKALRAALAEQPAEQESMAVACQISALGDSWADFPLERAQEAIEHGLNVRYLGVLRQKPVKPAEQEPVAIVKAEMLGMRAHIIGDVSVGDLLYTTPPDDTALLRQALEALAYWLEHGETPGAHDMIQRTHDALRERLG